MYASKLRERILEEFSIDYIIDLGCIYKNVKIYCALLVIKKTKLLNQNICLIKYEGNLKKLKNYLKETNV